MARRGSGAAEAAAAAASEAARVLQARGQEKASVRQEAPAEPAANEAPERPEPARVITPRNEPRRRSMEEVEQRDLRTKGMDLPGIQPPPEPDPQAPDPVPPKPEDILTGKAPDAPEAVVAAPEAPAEPEKTEVKTVRVKVDGEESDVPLEEVEAYGGVRAYQIAKAQENRLKSTKEALEETRKVQAQVAEWVQKMQPQQQQKSAADQQQELLKFIAEKIDVRRFGSPEEAAAAEIEIAKRLMPQVDQNEIRAQVTNQIRHDDAVQEFDRDFKDLVADPMILSWVVAERQKRLATVKGSVDWKSFYRTLGTEIRNRLGRPSQSAPVPAATSGNTSQASSEKEARKASITNLPVAAARAELPKADKPETPDEARKNALNEMKRARGIPTG